MNRPPLTKKEAEKLMYNKWVENPEGTPYKPHKCAYAVYSAPYGGRFFQCSKNPGHGPSHLYCKQHAKMVAASEKQRWEGMADSEVTDKHMSDSNFEELLQSVREAGVELRHQREIDKLHALLRRAYLVLKNVSIIEFGVICETKNNKDWVKTRDEFIQQIKDELDLEK